jgi:nucleosome binding factor SPN SPT16 subunit
MVLMEKTRWHDTPADEIPFETMTLEEIRAVCRERIASAQKHLDLAKRYRQERQRLERLYGVPLFRRRW